jgi:hypothetical protein
MTCEKNDNEWKMKKKWLSGLFRSDQLWLGINQSWFALEATKISISDGFGHTLKIGKFLVFIFFIYFHFFHMPYYPLWFIFIFWKIIKDFKTLSIDMKKHVNFLLMQIIFILW